MYNEQQILIDKVQNPEFNIRLLSDSELQTLLFATDTLQNLLFERASEKRISDFGKKVYVRGVIDISNYCVCSCRFCGNSCKSKINRYRMSGKDIVEAARLAKGMGIDIVHLASGEDVQFSFEELKDAVKEISQMGLKIELALGIHSEETLRKLYESGAGRFIMKFETSDSDLFEQVKICRVNSAGIYDQIKMMQNIGFEVGSGNIIGLPGQTDASLVNDLHKLSELDVNMASTSVFMPNIESEYANEKKGNANTALNFIALLRLMMTNKRVCIPSNSTLGKEGKGKALEIASNVLSLNLTPEKYAGQYSIYTGKDRFKANFEQLNRYIDNAGMKLSTFQEVMSHEN